MATADIADDIEAFYNPIRQHRHLGGLSPEQFEVANPGGRKRVH